MSGTLSLIPPHSHVLTPQNRIATDGSACELAQPGDIVLGIPLVAGFLHSHIPIQMLHLSPGSMHMGTSATRVTDAAGVAHIR